MKKYSFILCFSLCLALCASAAAGPLYDQLTAEEQSRLAAGDMVTRGGNRDATQTVDFTAYKLMNLSSTDAFWSVVTDFDNFPYLYGYIKKVTVLKKNDRQALVAFVKRGGPTTVHHSMIYTFSREGGRLDWTLDKSQPHKYYLAADGHWVAEQQAEGVYLLEYQIIKRFDLGVLSDLASRQMGQSIHRGMPKLFNRIEHTMETSRTAQR